ncbi:hypothetical protein THASP1DRAFT_14459 [Thamnocephalis sphaerospora]|uniref:Nop domain-containing protein n=1 Tax=Thamnocephalis sphaerospora TaxID=78915 RepID=A0A4P9XT13_9FUNG|nr:hypothetical protein THASP1DRAFT_14459 [Thamnocephalis sphaerospora]|eukprot:RKP09298.1 hypothetical protein THASP1DRAFT_14459 [Thamnocephalis sphaerospora]
MAGVEGGVDEADQDAAMKDAETLDREAREEAERQLSQLVAGAQSVHDVAKLLRGQTMIDVLRKIDEFTKQQATAVHFSGPVEEHPEYSTIVLSNNLTADVDNEILAVHKYARDHYAPRFPELESLVLNPIDFVRAVKAVGNTADLSAIDLETVLPSATIMVVTMAGSTSKGQKLDDAEWLRVEEACDMVLALDEARHKILDYVASRMQLIAPNLSAIIGTSTAAKMMGAAGGLTALSKIPACNVQVLGASAKARTGFSNIGMQRHAGFIYYSELISSIPPDLRAKATRIVAAKCTLAARIDRCHESTDGYKGKEMLAGIKKRLEKMQEPAPNKNARALPAPIEAAKKRRGGRRVRKQKEAYATTELQRQQNRIQFGDVETEASSMDQIKGLGMIGRQIGNIRAATATTKNKGTLMMQRRLKAYGSGSSGATSGLSSSLAFTPVQGIELENPEARAQKLKDLNSRYFDAAQGFLQLKAKRKREEEGGGGV